VFTTKVKTLITTVFSLQPCDNVYVHVVKKEKNHLMAQLKMTFMLTFILK